MITPSLSGQWAVGGKRVELCRGTQLVGIMPWHPSGSGGCIIKDLLLKVPRILQQVSVPLLLGGAQWYQISQVPQGGLDGSQEILSYTVIQFIQQSDGDTLILFFKALNEAVEHLMGPGVKLSLFGHLQNRSTEMHRDRECLLSPCLCPSVKAKPSGEHFSSFPNILLFPPFPV